MTGYLTLLSQIESTQRAEDTPGAGPFSSAALTVVVVFVTSIVQSSTSKRVAVWLAPTLSVVLVGIVYWAFQAHEHGKLLVAIVTAFVNAILVTAAAFGINALSTSGQPAGGNPPPAPERTGRWLG